MRFFRRHAAATLPAAPIPAPEGLATLTAALAQLSVRVAAIEASETLRSAEHAAQLDRLDRLYKRVSARIARGSDSPEPKGESVLDLKQRLKR